MTSTNDLKQVDTEDKLDDHDPLDDFDDDDCYAFEDEGECERNYWVLLSVPVAEFTPQDFWDFFSTCPHMVTLFTIEGEYKKPCPYCEPDLAVGMGVLVRLVYSGSMSHYGPLHPGLKGKVVRGDDRDALVAKAQAIVDEFAHRGDVRFVVCWQLYDSTRPQFAFSRHFTRDTAVEHLMSHFALPLTRRAGSSGT